MKCVVCKEFNEVGDTPVTVDHKASYLGVGVENDRPVIWVEDELAASARKEETFTVRSIHTGTDLGEDEKYMTHVGSMQYRGRTLHVYIIQHQGGHP